MLRHLPQHSGHSAATPLARTFARLLAVARNRLGLGTWGMPYAPNEWLVPWPLCTTVR